jgi:hypothetical protein
MGRPDGEMVFSARPSVVFIPFFRSLSNRATRREPTVVNALHITMIRRIFAICQDAAAIVLDAGKRCAHTLAHLKHASRTNGSLLNRLQWQPAFTSGGDLLGGWAETLRPTAASLMCLIERYRSMSAAQQTRQMAVARVARATVVR